MNYTKTDMVEAKRQIDSILHKLRATIQTLEAKDDPTRYKSQITLATRRIAALELANALIEQELDAAGCEGEQKLVGQITFSMDQDLYQLQEIGRRNRKDLSHDLVTLWRASVEATHLFLTKEDIDRIETYVPQAIQEVEHLVRAQGCEGVLLGFMGIVGQKIEMLFLHPAARRQGLGRRLIEYACEHYNISEVDVNEQNEQARAFYEHMGFVVVARSETDDAGDPFPILHMRMA